jgi:hypothetical protein
MSSLQDLIKKIQIGAANTDSYVYYDNTTGKIHKISSTDTPDEEYSIFPIANEEVKPILTGEKRIEEFIIFYDVSLKQVRLKEVGYEDTHRTSSTMCHQLPVIKNTHETHYSLNHVYEDMAVYIWDTTHSYKKGQCVWYNGYVYKLNTDIQKNAEFDLTVHLLFVKDVHLTSVPTQSHTAIKLAMVPEYVGIHVDVWYKELSHLAGQHVWLNGTVYRLLDDRSINTEFAIDNAEVIVNNVKLYADKNKSLETIDSVELGDNILKNNKLYSIKKAEVEYNKDKRSVFFYNTERSLLYHNGKNCIAVDLDDITETVIIKSMQLNLTDIQDLKNGQILLSGKQLCQIQTEKDYDVIVKQDTISKCWKIIINPYTRKFLVTSGHGSKEILYFSVTSKYDPNILYRSLEVTVGDLLSEATSVIPFKSDVESSASDVSIYTAKYFEHYSHEVV